AKSQAPGGNPTGELITQIGRELELRTLHLKDEALAVAEVLSRGRRAPVHPLARAQEHARKLTNRLKQALQGGVNRARVTALLEWAAEMERELELLYAEIHQGEGEG